MLIATAYYGPSDFVEETGKWEECHHLRMLGASILGI